MPPKKGTGPVPRQDRPSNVKAPPSPFDVANSRPGTSQAASPRELAVVPAGHSRDGGRLPVPHHTDPVSLRQSIRELAVLWEPLFSPVTRELPEIQELLFPLLPEEGCDAYLD